MPKSVKRKALLQNKSNILHKELLRRSHRITLVLNDKEKEALDNYCKKYKVENKVKFIRETVFKHIMDRFLSDYPTLFEDDIMQSMIVNEPKQATLF